jgi:hypothetical protein
MSVLLLTGAGFSRNWGGWLANEAFEYLLGCDLHPRVRQVLWESYDAKGGFEEALARMTLESDRAQLLHALDGMFNAMNTSFRTIARGPDLSNRNDRRAIAEFIGRFDAIFTLNQDLLIELRLPSPPSRPRRWDGLKSPGVEPLPGGSGMLSDPMVPVSKERFVCPPNFQPYFKLHGSSNFRADRSATAPLLVMGGNKSSEIDKCELLAWYHSEFKRQLPGSRVVIIGYSFGDDHINAALVNAAEQEGTAFFIIDPSGVDVIDKRPSRNLPVVRAASEPAETTRKALMRRLAGASRRSLFEIFGGDDVELDKLLRFVG